MVAAISMTLTSGIHVLRLRMHGAVGNSVHVGVLDAETPLTASTGGHGLVFYLYTGTVFNMASPYVRALEGALSFKLPGKGHGIDISDLDIDLHIDM